MNKRCIVLASVCIIFLAVSFVYKNQKYNIYSGFPLIREEPSKTELIPFYLFFYFHSHDCPKCLEVIQILNNLPRHFCIRGIIPNDDLKNVGLIRRMTGAVFPLISIDEYKKFVPLMSPALIGVTEAKQILFILPGVPDQKDYLINFLESFYYNRIFIGASSLSLEQNKAPRE